MLMFLTCCANSWIVRTEPIEEIADFHHLDYRRPAVVGMRLT